MLIPAVPIKKTNVNDPEIPQFTKLQGSRDDTPVTPNDIIVKIVTATFARDNPKTETAIHNNR